MFWIAVSHSRCQKILSTDAPGRVNRSLEDTYQALLGDLGVSTFPEIRRRCAKIERTLPRVSDLVERIIAANREIENNRDCTADKRVDSTGHVPRAVNTPPNSAQPTGTPKPLICRHFARSRWISNEKRYDPIGSAPAREARVLSVMPGAGALSIGAFERMPEDGLLWDLNCSCLEIGHLRGMCRLGIR